jgi:tryptophanyl-tRNA synthetase
MSKSDTSENAYIRSPTMPTRSRRRFVGRRPTSRSDEVEDLGRRPEADNLVGIFAALNDETKADVLKRFGGAQFSAFKTALADLTIAKLAPIRGGCCASPPIGYTDKVWPMERRKPA